MNDFNILFDSLLDLAKDKSQLLKENLFLRQQLIILKRSVKKLKIRKSDHMFFVFFRKFLSNWKECLYILKPDTILRWHRSLYRSFWRWYCKSKKKPKVRIPQQTLQLVRHMASSTLWGADFFTATTIGFKQLYVLVIMAIQTRKILHFAVTDHPTSDWTYRQVLQCTWNHPAARFLLIDRDNKYGGTFTADLKKYLRIKVLRTPFKTPKANAFCERLIGSIRRECLDHFLIFSQKHLRKILALYVNYYNNFRLTRASARKSPQTKLPNPQQPKARSAHNPYLAAFIITSIVKQLKNPSRCFFVPSTVFVSLR